MDVAKLRYLAERGHLGHAALLDPDTFVAQAAPLLGPPVGQLTAQNKTNELGLGDSLTIGISREAAPKAPSAGIDNKAAEQLRHQALADRLKAAGAPEADVLRELRGE